MKKHLFTLITFISIFLNLPASVAAEGDEGNRVVATVNGKNITQDELLKYHSQNLTYAQAFKTVTIETSLDDLINKIAGTDKAKTSGLEKDPTVIEKFNEILYHAQISKDLEKKLLQITVSDKEVDKFYGENPEYNTAQILLRLRAEPSPDEVKSVMDTATKIHEELLKSPESFAKLSAQYSQTSSSVTGGELGFQPVTRITPEYFDNIHNQPIGSITKPFRSQYGVHIVKVLAVKKLAQINKDLYKKIIYDIKRDKILADYFLELRNKAKISINKDLLKSL